ncbi:hypothetical protein [Woeseia oceani]|uniref:hypothetical protein n=1 Tax=Woeseia oceani TaxID=1548547 RepID=UPI0012EA867C|nr:hypothetical protein [Woeseia oceani]
MILQPNWQVIAVAAGLLFLGGCSQNPMHKDADKTARHCPAGSTMTCEADTIGRIRHGTFAKNNEKCACVQEGTRSLESPAIPSIH